MYVPPYVPPDAPLPPQTGHPSSAQAAPLLLPQTGHPSPVQAFLSRHKPDARPLHSPSPAATRRSDAVPLFLQAARPPQAAGLP